MLKRFSASFALFSLMLDLGLTAGAFGLAEYLRAVLPFGRFFIREAYVSGILYGVVVVIWLLVSTVLSVYDPKRTHKAVDELQAVIVADCFASLVFAGFLYLTFRQISRLLFVYFAFLDLIAHLAWRAVAHAAFRLSKGRSLPERRVLIAGAGELGRRLAATIREYEWTGLTVIGYLDDDPNKRDNGLLVLGTLGDACHVVHRYSVDELVIALPRHAYERLNALIADLQDISVNIRIVPDYFSLALFRATVEDFGGMPLINLREPVLNPYQRWVKRAMDVTLGSVALVLLSPIMLLVAVAVYLDSPGPVIFREQRVGENGSLFWMFKFRSMFLDANARMAEVVERTPEGRVIHKKRNDPRVTRVGKFIRSTSLDELPQLLNVLKGEMSLVGPRPELPWLVERYEPWQRKRFAVPQGITGWWQVNGRSDKLMHEHTEEDLYYIQNYSLLLDLQILWRTISAVIKRSGAY